MDPDLDCIAHRSDLNALLAPMPMATLDLFMPLSHRPQHSYESIQEWLIYPTAPYDVQYAWQLSSLCDTGDPPS